MLMWLFWGISISGLQGQPVRAVEKVLNIARTRVFVPNTPTPITQKVW